jgi:hypothetical protein
MIILKKICVDGFPLLTHHTELFIYFYLIVNNTELLFTTVLQPRKQQLWCCWYDCNNILILKLMKLLAEHFDTTQLK